MQGTGIVNDPYIVTTGEELNEIKNNLSAHYRLGNDIDLGNVEWEPIGIQTMAFTGVLDGAGYKISNLKIYQPQENYIGLFGYIDSATIKDLKVENVDIEGRNYVGALVGYANNRFYV
ncbi:MAG: peptidase M26, partial [Clostridia bacterium]|nr:peptidase M26 [Clostridia bacterium]